MSLGAPKVKPPAPVPAPAAQGADALRFGGSDEDAFLDGRNSGIGRLKLRVGNSKGGASRPSRATAATAAAGGGSSAAAAGPALSTAMGFPGAAGARAAVASGKIF